MDITKLEHKARIGAYDLAPELLSTTGHRDPESPRAKKKLEELKRELRDDCILAAIDAGLSRAQAKRTFDTVFEVAGHEGAQSIVKLMVPMIRAQL